MKKTLHILALLFISINIMAQAPQKMSYQAVIRNASNNLVTNTPVKMKISILQGSAQGTSVYSELHSATTNSNGLLSIEIGGGTSPTGTFSSINWGNGTYYLKTETDPNNGTNYSVVGTSQLLSVPYALESKNASSAGDGIKGISQTGDTVFLNNGKKYIIPGIKDVSAPATLNNGLVAYYPFNGNANDESGNGNNGTVNGATLTTDRFGNNNKAYSFNGSSNYIQMAPINALNNLSELTISTWVKIEGQNTNTNCNLGCSQFIVNRGADFSSNNLRLAYGQGIQKFATGLSNSNGVFSAQTFSIPFQNWINVVWVKTTTQHQMFINGQLSNSTAFSGLVPTSNDLVYFGYNPVGSFPYYLSGKLDDIRIYNRALSQEEITYLANN